jgi:hypothetical protein
MLNEERREPREHRGEAVALDSSPCHQDKAKCRRRSRSWLPRDAGGAAEDQCCLDKAAAASLH